MSDDPQVEIRALRRCINDLVSILALPALWSGAEPLQIVNALPDTILATLDLDVVYVRLHVPFASRAAHGPSLRASPSDVIGRLDECLGAMRPDWPPSLSCAVGTEELGVLPLRLGIHDEIGLIAAGSTRRTFPTEAERLVLRVAANQATIALHEARLLARTTGELHRQLARKAVIMDSALDCIITIDDAGAITEFNPAAESTFGYGRPDVIGKQLSDLIVPPALREQHRRGFARYLETGEKTVLGRRVEMTAMRADGDEFPIELTVTRIPTDGPPAFTGYVRDISARKRSEEELRRSETYLAEAQRLSQTGSFGWNVATDEHFWSPQTYAIFELPTTTSIALPAILDRVHPDDAAKIRCTLEAADGRDLNFECRLLTPLGDTKHLHVVAHAVRNRSGELEYFGAIQDITERRQSESALAVLRAELAHASRITTLGVLAASIAHEVNQPLSGIITNAGTSLRLLAASPPNIEGARECATRIARDGHRAADVIKRLRALFSKDVTAEPLDLNDAAREILALLSNELQRSDVSVTTGFAEQLPQVVGDRVQLQQVILNLLLNATEAMRITAGRPRHIVISTTGDGEYARLSVEDSGSGLDPDVADKVFEAFFTTKDDGMGIGLSVSRTIVESHRGRIWATSTPGAGATFTFAIPVMAGET